MVGFRDGQPILLISGSLPYKSHQFLHNPEILLQPLLSHYQASSYMPRDMSSQRKLKI